MRYTERPVGAWPTWGEVVELVAEFLGRMRSMVRFQTNRSVVARWSTGKGGEEMRYTERSSVGGRSLEDGMSLVEFLAWLDEWMPQAFGAPAHRDGALVVLRDIVVPRLIRELRERDAKGFAFYMSGNVGVMK